MTTKETLNNKLSPHEIYSKYIQEKSDKRFIHRIERMTDEEKVKWSKVELVICMPVHATGDIESQIVHTIENILLKNLTLDRSRLGIVVYVNCAKVELDDPIKLANQQKCFADLESYTKTTDINIQALFEVREDLMTIGGIRKVCNDHAVNLIHSLQIDREIATLCADSDLIKIPKNCLETFKTAIYQTISAGYPRIFIESNGEKPTEYNPCYIGARIIFEPPFSRSIPLTSDQISKSLFQNSTKEKERFPSEGFLGFLVSRYCEDGGFDKETAMLEGQQLIFKRNDLESNSHARITQIDTPVIFDPRRKYTITNGNWTRETWENGNNGSDARNIKLERNPDDQIEFWNTTKMNCMTDLFQEILVFNDTDDLIKKFKEVDPMNYSNSEVYRAKLKHWIIENFFVWGDHIIEICQKYKDIIDFSDAMYIGNAENKYKIDIESPNSQVNSLAVYLSKPIRAGLSQFFESVEFTTLANLIFDINSKSNGDIYDFKINEDSVMLSFLELEDNIPISQEMLDADPALVNKLKINRIVYPAREKLKEICLSLFKEQFETLNIKMQPQLDKKITRYKQMNSDLIEGKNLGHTVPQPKFRQIKISGEIHRVRYYAKSKLIKVLINY
jgi:hypothetical protein